MKNNASLSVWWIRRDLRLADNQTLTQALNTSDQVLPLFILDPKLLNSENISRRRLAFLFSGLQQLDADLRQKGSRLTVRSGSPQQVFVELKHEINFAAIYAEEDYSPYARQRDSAVAAVFDFHLCRGLTVQHPEEVVKADGNPYTVFTPFSRTWRDRFSSSWVIEAPQRISSPENVQSVAIPESLMGTRLDFQAGEAEAKRKLEIFTAGVIDRYHEDRDRMDLDGTSSLSPYFRFGMLSAGQVVNAALKAEAFSENAPARKGAEAWLNELIWREFYFSVLYHFPHVSRNSFREEMRGIRWLNREEDFNAWKEGRTGYPIVDAAMHQLNETGWMHNRARMITASFLTKDLLIDWRWGEKYFMQQLIDGDIAANNGGWQWSAGTGTDAAPYFRIFNPILQGKKFDPEGNYIRRWLPQLSSVPTAFIHSPWEMPAEAQQKTGVIPGKTYPLPVVDHAQARERAFRVYKSR